MEKLERSETTVSRRSVLRVGIAGALALASAPLIAACSGGPAATPAAPAVSAPTPTNAPAAAPPTAVPTPTTATAAQPTATPAPAAQSGAQAGATVNMTFLHFFTGVLWTGGFQHLVEQFQQQNPNIKWVGIESPYDQMMPKLITLSAGGQPPDGTSLDNTEINEIALRGLVKDLQPYISSDPTVKMDDFYKARLDEQRWKGKLYALPIDMGSGAIYYNKDSFDKAGLKYPDPKWTWNDVFDLAGKLTMDKNGKHPAESGFDATNVIQWGFQFQGNTYRYYNISHGFNGAEYFDKELTKTRFAEPEGVAAMQQFADLINKQHVSPNPAQTKAMQAGGIQPFTAGLYAMEHTWIGLIAYLHQEGVKLKNWDVVNLPESDHAAQEVGGQGFVVVEKAKQADASWKWTRYMVGDDAQKYLGVNGVWFPARKSMAPFGWPTDHQPASFISAFYDQVDKHGVACWWFVPGWNKWSQLITNEMDSLWTGSRDAKATATAVQQKIDPLVANWQTAVQ
jgi:multiple sugar transport system substrate-binding protein